MGFLLDLYLLCDSCFYVVRHRYWSTKKFLGDFLSYKAPISSENIHTETFHTSSSSAIGRFLRCLPLMGCENSPKTYSTCQSHWVFRGQIDAFQASGNKQQLDILWTSPSLIDKTFVYRDSTLRKCAPLFFTIVVPALYNRCSKSLPCPVYQLFFLSSITLDSEQGYWKDL
jgi:hypothetical protein